MQDTPISIAQCNRCHAYVYTCHTSGTKTNADPKPLRQDQYIQALITGLTTYDLHTTTSGQPHKLRTRTKHSTWNPTAVIVAEHPCRTTVTPLPEPDTPRPHQAPATRGEPRGGIHQPHAPANSPQPPQEASGQTPQPPAPPATHRPSRPMRCHTCRSRIEPGAPHVAIEHGRYLWAHHAEECP